MEIIKILQEHDNRNRIIEELRSINSFLEMFRNDPAFKLRIKTYDVLDKEVSEITLSQYFARKALNFMSERANELETEIMNFEKN